MAPCSQERFPPLQGSGWQSRRRRKLNSEGQKHLFNPAIIDALKAGTYGWHGPYGEPLGISDAVKKLQEKGYSQQDPAFFVAPSSVLQQPAPRRAPKRRVESDSEEDSEYDAGEDAPRREYNFRPRKKIEKKGSPDVQNVEFVDDEDLERIQREAVEAQYAFLGQSSGVHYLPQALGCPPFGFEIPNSEIFGTLESEINLDPNGIFPTEEEEGLDPNWNFSKYGQLLFARKMHSITESEETPFGRTVPPPRKSILKKTPSPREEGSFERSQHFTQPQPTYGLSSHFAKSCQILKMQPNRSNFAASFCGSDSSDICGQDNYQLPRSRPFSQSSSFHPRAAVYYQHTDRQNYCTHAEPQFAQSFKLSQSCYRSPYCGPQSCEVAQSPGCLKFSHSRRTVASSCPQAVETPSCQNYSRCCGHSCQPVNMPCSSCQTASQSQYDMERRTLDMVREHYLRKYGTRGLAMFLKEFRDFPQSDPRHL
ncbi:hypothetical protein QR680_009017 [Steinernema hermaphroditum]|uniref:Uncharacterized protein n=1 Tax=Steinernema hermaphroditum TaxID=289476 RepID=A0AA39IIQ7_9BILA|nr:hypothetical protein QR680_009017 [Steinernema hermaphroditum]